MGKSKLHSTPVYRLKAAYLYMRKNAAREEVAIHFSEVEFIAWALPIREAFIEQNPGKHPSFRRIDADKPYTFDNMCCVVQGDGYRAKQHSIVDGKKWCRTCDTMKTLDHFTKNKSSVSGYAYECRECVATQVKQRNARPEIKEARRLQRRKAALGQNNGRAMFTDAQVLECREHAKTLDYKAYQVYCRSLVSAQISLRAVQNMLRGINYSHLPEAVTVPARPPRPQRIRAKKPSAIRFRGYDDNIVVIRKVKPTVIKPVVVKPILNEFDPKKTGVVKLYKARGWSPQKVAGLLNVRVRDIVAVW